MNTKAGDFLYNTTLQCYNFFIRTSPFNSDKKVLLRIGKLTVITLAGWFIYHEVLSHSTPEQLHDFYLRNLTNPTGFLLLISGLVLMPVNWVIESYKWKVLVQKLHQISIDKAIRAVFTGITWSIFTPHRVGEFAGRISYLPAKNRTTGALITIMGSISQLIITLLVGFAGIFTLLADLGALSPLMLVTVGFTLILCALLLIIIYLNAPLFTGYFCQNPLMRKWIPNSRVFRGFSSAELLGVLLLSLARYMVFTLQFFLLLRLFGVDISAVDGLQYISLTFISMVAIPTGILTEIGVREVVALHFLGMVSANKLGIISASFVLWLINLAIPAMIGASLMLLPKPETDIKN